MKLKPNYIVIPLITVIVALAGSYLTRGGMEWYDTQLVQPDFTPPNWAFPIAWNTIFALTTISALIVWNKKGWNLIAALFILNAVLNVVWSLLFFNLHMLTPAFIEMIILELTLLALIPLIWKTSKTASLLLLPYTLWVGFATYLTYMIVTLN
ncbi:MAG: TspO/MBR family protein [Patescibacteria group bacterium]|nr:tryptophan-rich sensory protein [Patescibacteria group bacterium]